eukprot:s1714_g4.t1
MALDFAAEEPLTFADLLTVEEDLEPYVLEWPSVPDADGLSEALAVVVLKRQAGFLLAVPSGFMPEAVLDRANQGMEAGPIGPSAYVEVPAVLVEQGIRPLTGSTLTVLLVDVAADLAPQLRRAEEQEDIAMPFDPDAPFNLPSPQDLLRAARDWISQAGEDTSLGFYSATGGEAPEEDEEQMQDGLPETPTPARRARGPSKAKAAPSGGGGVPKPKPKRATTASLATSMEQLLAVVPSLSSQIQDLAQRHELLEKRLVAPSRAGALGLSQPLSSSLVPQQPVSASAVVQALATPPPRAKGQPAVGLLHQQQQNFQPEGLAELEEEKPLPGPADSDLAKAVYAQSQALTALVGQIAQSSQDPMMDLSAGLSSTATRRATGRAKLQAELALHSGSFFDAVLRSMARRMQPTSPSSGSPEELLARGISGTRYMERYGGFGRRRDLGLVMYQVMGIMDFLQSGNTGAAKDATALLAVCLDQAVLDGGRFDLAALLTLQEDPPSTIFVNRQQSSLSRARAFSQLADQRWVTTALAFVKELDLIQSKRQELSGQNAASAKAQASAEPTAKAKPQAKRKGKGAQKGAGGGQQPQQQHPEAEEE